MIIFSGHQANVFKPEEVVPESKQQEQMNTANWDSQSIKIGSLWERTAQIPKGHTSRFYLRSRYENISIFPPPTKTKQKAKTKTSVELPSKKGQCTQKITTSELAQIEKTFPWRGSTGNCQLEIHQYNCSRASDRGLPFRCLRCNRPCTSAEGESQFFLGDFAPHGVNKSSNRNQNKTWVGEPR